MSDVEYDVVHVGRVPASMKPDEFAAMVDEMCNGRAAGGWRLVSAVGDYGAVLTLGVWLIFVREVASAIDRPIADTDEDAPGFEEFDEDRGESHEPAQAEGEKSTE